MTTDDYESWRVALARVEGKIDTMVELATRMQVAVTDLDRRVRDVETSMARVKQQLSEIERHEAPRANWVGVMSAVVAAITLGFFIAERLFTH
jgi:hypothetical protein